MAADEYLCCAEVHIPGLESKLTTDQSPIPWTVPSVGMAHHRQGPLRWSPSPFQASQKFSAFGRGLGPNSQATKPSHSRLCPSPSQISQWYDANPHPRALGHPSRHLPNPPSVVSLPHHSHKSQVPSRAAHTYRPTPVTLTAGPYRHTSTPYLPFSKDLCSSRSKRSYQQWREGEMCYGAQILRTTAKPQQVVTTRLLHCLQYQVPHLSRLQRIHPRAYFKLQSEVEPTRPFRQAGR
jgi:hypothetical protein